ncbi:metal-dependent hydrolase [Candidatus Steffania adelgidicola]|uniref:metal-dependent hydrolase n=1 Tax=Candidatus Steffania adelgidicola TaxID=1076626 RepID=UPI001D009F19|nr:metal-dependent hydrolase [Candidatus Steffania adelgidicola]
MTAEGHFIFALASTILAKKTSITSTLAQGDWWHIIAGGLLAGILPDIDHPKSILGQRLTWLSIPISRVFGHRGFTHSLLAIITGIALFILGVPSSKNLIPLDAWHGIIIGYLSHIIADMLTPAGVPLLWPCRWRFCIPILHPKKGNHVQRLLCIILLIFALQHQTGTPITQHLSIPDTIHVFWKKIRHSLLQPP